MSHAVISSVSGLIFAVGLALSGMTEPGRVLAFLNLRGDWDPSLLLVMVAAVGVYALVFRAVQGRPAPLLGGHFAIPTRRDIDGRLLLGASLFGLGWGLAGYCPGPVLASALSLRGDVLVFLAAMIGGMALFELWTRAEQRAKG